MAKNKTESKALAKRGTSSITKWDEELAKHAAQVSDSEQMPTGQFVSLKGGIMSIAGQPVKDNKVRVVILASMFENALYDGAYDPDAPAPPVCYAFGTTEEELKPHEKSSDPKHDQCSGCPNNVFGSAEKGKGKACKNTRRLALLSADGLTEKSAEDGEVVMMKLPVTSTKGWAYFVKGLNSTLRRPPFGVVTEIAVVPDASSQFKVTFQYVENVDDSVMGAVMARREKVVDMLAAPYPEKAAEAPKAKGKAGKGKPAAKARKF